MVCPAIITFDVLAFRAMYAAFANQGCFPDVMLAMYWDQATAYVSNKNYGWMRGVKRELAINLMTAHLVALSQLIANGENPGVVTGATIDKVSATLAPPPLKNQWQYWLSTTPYGAQLLALLQVSSVGGWYTGGSPTRAGFNGAGGIGGWC